jgi:hypothetical protein
MGNYPRWVATIYYRSDKGMLDVEYVFEELEELQGLVERGPDWNTIDKIEVRLARKTAPRLTIEGANHA